jgi:6-pyruvoyltetrahydropterin/6-carboxytetrahydropterin synthase
MIIRKLFKYEMSHRVHGAYTRRCSHSIHGHSYKLELLFSGDTPDSAQMVMDFGFVKKYFHPFVDSFDHAHMVWQKPEMMEEVAYTMDNNERWIVAPFSSTAEMQAKMFLTYSIKAINELEEMGLVNKSVTSHSAIVHETDTGYADYGISDFMYCNFPTVKLSDIKFSEGCMKDWSSDFKEFYNKLLAYEKGSKTS